MTRPVIAQEHHLQHFSRPTQGGGGAQLSIVQFSPNGRMTLAKVQADFG